MKKSIFIVVLTLALAVTISGQSSAELAPSNLEARAKAAVAVIRGTPDESNAAAQLFDRGPLARPGDGYTVNATAFAGSSFNQLAGASYREIFDLSDWDNAVAVNVPGQSGQPGSAHYDDLLPLWANGQYFPLRYTKQSVDRETADVLELKP